VLQCLVRFALPLPLSHNDRAVQPLSILTRGNIILIVACLNLGWVSAPAWRRAGVGSADVACHSIALPRAVGEQRQVAQAPPTHGDRCIGMRREWEGQERTTSPGLPGSPGVAVLWHVSGLDLPCCLRIERGIQTPSTALLVTPHRERASSFPVWHDTLARSRCVHDERTKLSSWPCYPLVT
jgi:hypothetical protein